MLEFRLNNLPCFLVLIEQKYLLITIANYGYFHLKINLLNTIKFKVSFTVINCRKIFFYVEGSGLKQDS